jgi:transcriptional regulator with XRE-family HTH domain
MKLRVLKTRSAAALRFEAMAAEYLERQGRRIRERRDELGLSRDEVARRMGGKENGNSIYRWEKGRHEPSPDARERLATALGVDVAYFFSDDPVEASEDASPAEQSQLDRIEARVNILLDLVTRLLGAEADRALAEAEAEQARRGQDPPSASRAA